jgi:hypothetical protein
VLPRSAAAPQPYRDPTGDTATNRLDRRRPTTAIGVSAVCPCGVHDGELVDGAPRGFDMRLTRKVVEGFSRAQLHVVNEEIREADGQGNVVRSRRLRELLDRSRQTAWRHAGCGQVVHFVR